MNKTPLADTREIYAWIEMLGWDEAQCQSAVRWLEQQGLVAVPELLLALQREERYKEGWKLIANVSFVGILFIVAVSFFRPAVLMDPFLWLAFCSPFVFYQLATRATPRQQRIMEILARLEDVEAVGALLDTLNIGTRQDWYGRTVTRAALTRLLPRLKASDASHLTEKHWDTLHRELQTEDAPLLLAILKALEQVGDARSLPHIEKLVHRSEAMANIRFPLRLVQRLFPDKERMLPAEWRQVGEAAEVCREILQVRYEEREMEQSLLRPAEAFVAPPEELLRPAAGADSTPQEQLLRPKCLAEEPTSAAPSIL